MVTTVKLTPPTQKEVIDLVPFSVIHQIAKEAMIKAENDALETYRKNNPTSHEPLYCGFAWVEVYDIKLSTKLGKLFKSLGFDKSWKKGPIVQLWSSYGGQSMDIKEIGCEAYAKVLRLYGFKAYMCSRPD